MSEVRVNNIVDYGGKGAPTFDNGAVISGVSSLGNQAKIGSNVTITSGGINVSGVTTAATLSGNLTGDVNTGFVTATSAVIGSGVTINAGGLNITGVVTATTFEGSGASMTGVAMTITPLAYNPDVNDSIITPASGIGITFDHRILAGSGNVTLSIATNAGAAGTTVENFGVGSSVTIQGRKAIIDPTSDLTFGETYHISYPSGAFTNTGGDVDYVGTAYTFGVKSADYQLWTMGYNHIGQLGQNSTTYYSSPIQIPGTDWRRSIAMGKESYGIKSDGTLWSWGYNNFGQLGLNNRTNYSSPVQIPGTTWQYADYKFDGNNASDNEDAFAGGVKTDGTMWAWGFNGYGELGQNNRTNYSSPVQVGSDTTWSLCSLGTHTVAAIKTNGTLWMWGYNTRGELGQNDKTHRSSPVQIPGTTWSKVSNVERHPLAIKTDGTLWTWGKGYAGEMGTNISATYRSSPIQIPGTTWSILPQGGGGGGSAQYSVAGKTDGTLFSWGANEGGALGINIAEGTNYSSPVQIPGTTWNTVDQAYAAQIATKTDGTLWSWGYSIGGRLGLNQGPGLRYSSPVQIPGTNWENAQISYLTAHAIKKA